MEIGDKGVDRLARGARWNGKSVTNVTSVGVKHAPWPLRVVQPLGQKPTLEFIIDLKKEQGSREVLYPGSNRF